MFLRNYGLATQSGLLLISQESPCFVMTTPCTRPDPDCRFETAVQMALVTESTGQCHFGKAKARITQERLCAVDALCNQPAMGRLANRLSKHSGEKAD